MKKNLTELVFILDMSGSMASLTDDTIGGYNSLLEKQKGEEGEALVSTVLFNTDRNVIHDRVDIRKIEPLTEQQYSLFRVKFRDYPWMPDFEAHYAPLFEAHKKTVYCFNEEELLAWSIGDLSQEDRLRILLAMRSVDNPSNVMLGKFLESVPPSRTHAIMK